MPHANGDGRALHVVQAESKEAAQRHLAHFDGIYSHGEIIEVVSLPTR